MVDAVFMGSPGSSMVVCRVGKRSGLLISPILSFSWPLRRGHGHYGRIIRRPVGGAAGQVESPFGLGLGWERGRLVVLLFVWVDLG